MGEADRGAELPLRDDLDAAQQERFKKSASETKRGDNWKEDQIDGRKLLKSLARPEGFEPPTLRSEV